MTDRRSAIDPGEPERGRGPSPAVLAAIGAVLVVVVALLTLQLGRTGQGDPAATPSLQASPATETVTPAPTVTPTPTATPTATATAPPPTASPTGPRPATAADAAAFAEEHREQQFGGGGDSVVVDVDGNGDDEVVFAGVTGGSVRVDVAAWQGNAYEVVFSDQGGAGERLDDLLVVDFTGDGLREVVTHQSSGTEGASLSIWGLPPADATDAAVPDPADYQRHTAVGGCWDGSHTYGVRGAEIRLGEITATCDASPLPMAAWPSDVYVWDGQAWTYDRTVGP